MGRKGTVITAEMRRELARRHGAEPGKYTPAQCHYCGSDGRIWWWPGRRRPDSGYINFIDLEIDHVEPVHLGGATTSENLVLACSFCNRSKGTNPQPVNTRSRNSRRPIGERDHDRFIEPITQNDARLNESIAQNVSLTRGRARPRIGSDLRTKTTTPLPPAAGRDRQADSVALRSQVARGLSHG